MFGHLKASGVALFSVGCALSGLAVLLWLKGFLTFQSGLILDLPRQGHFVRVPLGYVIAALGLAVTLGVLMILAATRRHRRGFSDEQNTPVRTSQR